jgi:uncharacterized damage-inducible protein DinB
MKRTLALAIPVALLGLLFAQPKGAPLDLAGDLKAQYNAGKSKIIAAAEQMPEESYSFRPAEGANPFSYWVAHTADFQSGVCGGVAGNAKQLGAAQKTAKADLLAALKESFDICDAAYEGTTAANANDTVQTFFGPRARASWLWFNVAHNEEGYGAMTVYLRMQKIVPPSTAARAKGKKGK